MKTPLNHSESKPTETSLEANNSSAPESPSPTKHLIGCKERWALNEQGYRKAKYELMGEVYGQAIKMLADNAEASVFYSLPYWRGPRLEVPRATRDLFRDVFAFVLDAATVNERKIASKYAGVLIELFRAEVPPEHAASRIANDGGIERIHLHGLSIRLSPTAADMGDGMDAGGNKIAYHEDQLDNADGPDVFFENLELLRIFKPKQIDDVIFIEASWSIYEDGLVYRISAVSGETREKTADPSPDQILLIAPQNEMGPRGLSTECEDLRQATPRGSRNTCNVSVVKVRGGNDVKRGMTGPLRVVRKGRA